MHEAKTLHVIVTDAEIRKHTAGNVRQLRDPRFPELRFRYSTADRAKGAWHVVVRGKWGKAGNYPGINAKAMQSTLPAILTRRSADPDALSTTTGWRTVGDLLAWYQDRMPRDRGLSAKRKCSARSAVKCHLLPRLGTLPLKQLNHSNLDQLLLWPLQETLSLSFVRSIYGVLAVSFRQAFRLGLIEGNPMATLKFGDFVQTRIRPKPAGVRADDLEALLAHLVDFSTRDATGAMLALVMLCHGTRLGETRMARWKHFNLTDGQWFIPAEDTKTKHEHTLPLTPQACSMLLRYRERQEASGYRGTFVFPTPAGRLLSANRASEIFRQISGGDWSSHDLRKVARTAWMDLGVDYLVGELLVNHAMKDLDATYIHTTAEQLKRAALERWHAWLDGRGFGAFHTGTYAGHGTLQVTAQPLNDVAYSQSEDALHRRTLLLPEGEK